MYTLYLKILQIVLWPGSPDHAGVQLDELVLVLGVREPVLQGQSYGRVSPIWVVVIVLDHITAHVSFDVEVNQALCLICSIVEVNQALCLS